jgi:hypothetical protein
MKKMNEIPEENVDVVNEPIDAAFRAGSSGREAPDVVAEAVRHFSE